jgi:hypothetical protein
MDWLLDAIVARGGLDDPEADGEPEPPAEDPPSAR